MDRRCKNCSSGPRRFDEGTKFRERCGVRECGATSDAATSTARRQTNSYRFAQQMGCQRAAHTSYSGAMMKIAILLMLSIFPLACASAPTHPSCQGAASVEYKGIQRLKAWDKESPFGSFAVSNKAGKELKIPLDSTYYPVIVHGRHIEVQSRPVASDAHWELDTVVLEEFLPPRKWMVIAPGDGAMFFVDMAGPAGDSERSRSREYRVVLKDDLGCQYLSQPFRVN